MGSVAKLISQNIVWRGLYYLSNFILTLTIARHFQAATSGDLFYITNNCAFVVLLFSLSFEAAIVFFGSNDSIEKRKLFWSAHLIVIIASVLLGLFFIGSKSFFLNSNYNLEYRNVFLFITGNLVANFMAGFYFADKNFAVPNLVSVIINSLLLISLSFTLEETWLNNSKFLMFYFSSFFIQGITLALILFLKNKTFWRIGFFSKEDFAKVYHYLSLVFLGNIITFFCYRLDYWFVKYYCSANELGNYIQVSKLVQLFFVMPGMLATVLFPLASGGAKQKVKEMIPFLTKFILLAYSLIFLVLILIGNRLFPFIFGKSFSLMYSSFLFYIPGILGFSALYTFASFYSGTNKVIVNLKGCGLALIIIILGDFFFIPRFGINAAAAVSSCAYLIYFVFVLRVFMKEFGLSAKAFFLWSKKDWSAFKTLIKQNH
jgi:O-antigen/teichoic acid export membrane protein